MPVSTAPLAFHQQHVFDVTQQHKIGSMPSEAATLSFNTTESNC
jgi:hypothetical protein